MVQVTPVVRRVHPTADGDGLVSRAGLSWLGELADRSGLTEGMSKAMAGCGIRWWLHDPGRVLTQLALAIADGADCLSDMAVLRDQPDLFGAVASHATAWRAVEAVTSEELRGIARARAHGRERVWAAGGAPATLTLDFDATLVTAYSEKQDAAPTYKGGFGFHPLLCWLDETGEPLAAKLRAGNAGANTAADHVQVLDEALAQLPPAWVMGHRPGDDPALVAHPILARADAAGATHDFVAALRERNIGFSVGYEVDGRVRDALLLAQEEDWVPAVEADGTRRDGAWVIELTELVNLGAWPEGTRLICRRERPHPGAQLSLFDSAEGFRHTCFLTDSPDTDIARLECRQRGHARVEDRVREAKDCGLANLPFEDFVRNQVWFSLSLVAQDLLAWGRRLCCDGALARAEPKTLRYRLLHVAARVVRRARRLELRIDRTWPWRHHLLDAFARLRRARC